MYLPPPIFHVRYFCNSQPFQNFSRADVQPVPEITAFIEMISRLTFKFFSSSHDHTHTHTHTNTHASLASHKMREPLYHIGAREIIIISEPVNRLTGRQCWRHRLFYSKRFIRSITECHLICTKPNPADAENGSRAISDPRTP